MLLEVKIMVTHGWVSVINERKDFWILVILFLDLVAGYMGLFNL